MKTETIGPKEAEALLAANTRNRNILRGVVTQYAEDMAAGRWMLNGDTLVIGTDGTLLNGQHRLHAVIKSNTKQQFIVVRGVAPESFVTIDQGAKRSAGQILGLLGHPSAHRLAAICRNIEIAAVHGGKEVGISAARLQEVLDEHPLAHHYSAALGRKGLIRLHAGAWAAAVFTLGAEKYGRDLVDDFVEQVENGEGLSRGDPALALRDRLQARIASRTHHKSTYLMALTIKCVKAYCQRKPVLQIKWDIREEFPEL